MRCLVTGAAGFVGSSIADALLEKGHDVAGIDCFIDYYPKRIKLQNIAGAKANSRYTFIEQNLLEADMEGLLRDVDWVFHQAAQAGVRASWGSTFSIYTDNNIRATQRLLEAAKTPAVRKTLKKIVYASSSSVYGSAETLPTNEQVLPAPVSPYGVSKLAAEHLMVLYAKEFGVPTVSLRYFTVYGPRQRPDMAFNRFVRAALQDKVIELYGTGEQSRDFTFISDIVKANLLAAERPTAALVYNVGGGSRVTVNEVLSHIERFTGRPLKVERKARAAGDASHTGADTSLLFSHLGFKPTVSVVEGLQHELRWMEEALKSGYSAEG